MTRTQARAALALAMFGAASYVSGQTVVKADKQWSSEGQFLAYPSDWCSLFDKTLVVGRDYANTVTYQTGQLGTATNVQFSWRYPSPWQRSKKCGVFGYSHVAWGNYEGGATMKPVAPRQIKSLSDMTVTYGVDFAADPSQFNGLSEAFLTGAAGNPDDKKLEVGFFWNAPAETIAWAKTGKQLGTFTDRYGKRWTVAQNEAYVTFTPVAGSQTWGTLDVSGGLTFLTGKGIVSPNWYVNGWALGVEPLGGFGTAIVRSFKVAQK